MLSDDEIVVLRHLSSPVSFEELVKQSGLDSSSVERALLWLSSKKLVRVKSVVKELVSLGLNGERYVVSGLPEKRLVGFVLDGVSSVSDLRELFDKDDFAVALGVLKERGFVAVINGVVKLSLEAVKWYGVESCDDELLSLLRVSSFVDYSLLGARLRRSVDVLSSRKNVLRSELKVSRTVLITAKGARLIHF